MYRRHVRPPHLGPSARGSHAAHLHLVVIHNLDIISMPVFPREAYPPLFVDADAVLAPAIALQSFKPVARRHTQRIQGTCCIDLQQLAPRDTLQVMGQTPREVPVEEPLGILVPAALDHGSTLTQNVNNGKRYHMHFP